MNVPLVPSNFYTRDAVAYLVFWKVYFHLMIYLGGCSTAVHKAVSSFILVFCPGGGGKLCVTWDLPFSGEPLSVVKYIHIVPPLPPSASRTFFFILNWNAVPQALVATILLPASANLNIPGVSNRWNHTILSFPFGSGLFHLESGPRVHPSCLVCQNFIFFEWLNNIPLSV